MVIDPPGEGLKTPELLNVIVTDAPVVLLNVTLSPLDTSVSSGVGPVQLISMSWFATSFAPLIRLLEKPVPAGAPKIKHLN